MTTEQRQVGLHQASSSGGTITWTRTGMIHQAGKVYGGERGGVGSETLDGQLAVVKRGRGRPRKNP